MFSVGYYRAPEESKASTYRDGLLIREGFMTTRQGYPGVELGFPFVQREDLPIHGSRDGSQMGPVFFNRDLPYNVHEHARGDHTGVRQGNAFTSHGGPRSGHKRHSGTSLEGILAQDPNFINGGYYPYRRNHNLYYSNLPYTEYAQPRTHSSNFEVKPDELRKWTYGTRA